MSNERTACFAADKLKFVKSDPRCSVALLKVIFFVDLLQIKDKFHCQESITYMVCPLTRERKQKKNTISIFKSVRVRIRESVRLRECVNRKFD